MATKTGRTKPSFESIGVTGLDFSAMGTVEEEKIPDLRGAAGREILREMSENEPTVVAVMNAIRAIVRGVKWSVSSSDDSPESLRWAEFVDNALHNMTTEWDDIIDNALDMLIYGWSAFEVIYKKRSDGLIGWSDWSVRAQTSLYRWEFDDRGRVTAMVQQSPSNFKIYTIPMENLLLFRTVNHKGSPEGWPIIRGAYVPWFRKKRIESYEGIGLERDLAGIPVIECPEKWASKDASAAEKANFDQCKQIVTTIKSNRRAGVVLPISYDDNNNPSMKFYLTSAAGKRNYDTTQIINRYKNEILMVLLADFMMLGHESNGSWALSADKTEMFQAALAGYLKNITETVNNLAIRNLMVVNGADPALAPTVAHSSLDSPALSTIGEFVRNLASSGAIQADDKLDDHMRQMAGIPLRDVSND